MTVQRLKLAGVAIGCFAFLAAASGVAFAQSKCTGGELKASSKKAGGKAKCWAKATGKGLAVDGTCLSGAEGKFSASYAKAVGKGGCVNTTDAGTIETKVDNFITDLVTEINGGTGTPTASKCSSKEIGAAGKKAGGLLKCYSKAASKNLPLDSACTGKAVSKFGASWTKATAAGGCLTTVDQGTIETKVDNFTADVNSELTAAGPTTTTTTTPGSTTTTTMGGPCCGINPTRLNFTTGTGAGTCGNVRSSTGAILKNLACGGLYTGGGSNSVPLPYAVPDMGSSLTGVSACNSGTHTLTLTNLTSGATGSNRNCTSVGCLFGPPLPIPNPGSTPTSVCVINSVTANATGTANCSSGASSLNLPLNSEIFLDGDLLPARPGIQVCPVCLGNACVGGSNNGAACTLATDCPGGSCVTATVCHTLTTDASNGKPCTPADSPINAGFPTSQDCPPPASLDIGGLPIAFALTTGSQTSTGQLTSDQANVHCGYCRDGGTGPTGTSRFEGNNATAGCPNNSGCTAGGTPFPCCTGLGTGGCNLPPKQCFNGLTNTSTACTDGSGSTAGRGRCCRAVFPAVVPTAG